MEKWKDVIGYEGIYQISNSGRLKSMRRKVKGRRGVLSEKIMAPCFNGHYYHYTLCKNDTIKILLAHRLVGLHFVPNPEKKPCINHLDGDKLNNNDWNLEWSTIGENTRHAINVLGLVLGGEKHHAAKLTERKVLKILSLANSGCTQNELATKFGVSNKNIGYIIRRKTWKHLKVA